MDEIDFWIQDPIAQYLQLSSEGGDEKGREGWKKELTSDRDPLAEAWARSVSPNVMVELLYCLSLIAAGEATHAPGANRQPCTWRVHIESLAGYPIERECTEPWDDEGRDTFRCRAMADELRKLFPVLPDEATAWQLLVNFDEADD